MLTGWFGRAGVLVLLLSGAGYRALAQAPAPPVLSPATAAEQSEEPQAPAIQAKVVNPFPAVDPKNFTTDTPTVGVMNDFLKAVWGSNENRIWSVAAIQKTAAPGVSRVVVLVADKLQPKKLSENVFFVTPDGKHAIADTIIDFGAKPFEARRTMLQARAEGAGEGAKGRQLLLVEFGDLLNAKSKEAHATATSLLKDFPEARLVYVTLPAEGRPYAFKAAAEGDCLRRAKGDDAFFTYAQTIYDRQDTLTAATADAVFGAAVTAAGGDAKAVAACADTQAAKDEVKASVALAADADVQQAPVLVINGHVLPQTTTAGYQTLKDIVAFQAGQDGIVVHVQPTLSTLK